MMINFPKWSKPLFQPKRYKSLRGGRGSGKSYTVAMALLIIGTKSPCRILCAREFQNSISDSVHKLLSDQITEMGLDDFYSVTASSISGLNGTEFIFKGVRTNVQSIKSMAGITHLWLEEAQTVSKESWDILIPTIREPNSEIWVTFNPLNDDDPTYKMFVDERGESIIRDDILSLKINWTDNPFFPEVLRKEKDYLYLVDPDLAQHVWEGQCRTISDAQIFKDKYSVETFDINPSWNGPYYGADWGFSQDPNTLVKVYVDTQKKILYIRSEFYERGVDTDILPSKWRQMEGASYGHIRADNARPETISYMVKQGFRVEAAKKWSGSVEDGITYLRSFTKIIIHTDCPQTAQEAKKYSYKVDRLTGDVLTTIVDDWNHCFDAIRYSLDALITNGTSILDVL